MIEADEVGRMVILCGTITDTPGVISDEKVV